MNRKLLNGLLVLAVAAGGVGTFTSCKDENFSDDVRLGQASLQTQIDAIRDLSDADFYANLDKFVDYKLEDYATLEDLNNAKAALEAQIAALRADMNTADTNLQNQINALEDRIKKLEEAQHECEAIEKIWENIKEGKYQEVKDYVDALYKMLFENIFPDQAWFKQIFANEANIENLLQRATSVSVNHVYNPVFGTINLPVGINSTVLATYMYKSTQGAYNFPADAAAHLNESSPFQPDSQFANDLNALGKTAVGNFELPANGMFEFADAQEFGNMGGALVAINPANNNFADEDYTVELVNSKGEVALGGEKGGVELGEYDDLIYFGASRADNAGVYALKVSANENNYEDLVFDLAGDRSNIKNALKQAVHNKKLSDIAHLGETVFDAVNDKLPAYAVRVSWEENVIDENGNVVEGQTVTNSVYSDFDLAATIVHPLSYGLDLGSVLPSNKKLPIIHNPLTYYLDKVKNKITIDLSLDVNINIDKIDLLATFTSNGTIRAYVLDAKGNIVGADAQGNPTKDSMYIELEYTADGVKNPKPETFDQFIHDLLSSIQDQVNDTMIDEVQKSLEDAISSINDQLAEVDAKLGEIRDLIDRVEKSKLLTYGQKLVDVYNELAEKANDFLTDPNHYLQVMMAYSTGDGAHHMSNDPYYPITVNSAEGNGLELLVSSYTGDVLVPSFKKYVAITGEYVNGAWTTANNASLNANQEYLNHVLPGQQMRCPVNVTPLKGKTVRLTYMSVDYRGMVSMENYYLRVK